MVETHLKIAGIDPLLFRDGRPFSREDGALTARTLPVPLPGTLAGFLRTFHGNQKGWEWNSASAANALQIPVHAPLMLRKGTPVFPSPADALLYEDGIAAKADERVPVRLMKLRPWLDLDKGAGCNLPHGALAPLEVTEDAKPASGNQFWSKELMERWLLDTPSNGNTIRRTDFHEGLPMEERVHVAIDRTSGRGEDGKLFTTHRLGFEDHSARVRERSRGATEAAESVCWSLAAKVGADLLPGIGTLGGERGLATVEITDSRWFACPSSVKTKLRVLQPGSDLQIRMILATPGIFEGGWRPGWLHENGGNLEGAPPGVEDLRLRLVSVAAGRREPVSGWDFLTCKPKTVRWMVPAGAVYFFEVIEGDFAQLGESACWLAPVSDAEQDRNDGYGLAMWGFWTRNDSEKMRTEGEGANNR